MRHEIERLLDAYERGDCTRRTFVASLSALLAVPSVGQPNRTAPFVARGLNHVTLTVPDVSRSRNFYRNVLGLPVLRQDETGCDLSIGGSSFLGLYASHGNPSIDHFCIGVEEFDLKAAQQKLAAMSINATVEYGNQLYFRDPNGLRVQFSSPDYRG